MIICYFNEFLKLLDSTLYCEIQYSFDTQYHIYCML